MYNEYSLTGKRGHFCIVIQVYWDKTYMWIAKRQIERTLCNKLFKSIKLSILAIIPNIFASSFILGIIGFLSIPLDIMTITIAAITIGIAVDNTIHYLYRFKEFNKDNLKSK